MIQRSDTHSKFPLQFLEPSASYYLSRVAHSYPIVWTDVLQTYQITAAAAKYLAVFGLLEYWWFGEHGQPRLDYSSDVYFTTDELAARFLEEIDFDYQDVAATASLQTAAA
jgi:hypothetical protein